MLLKIRRPGEGRGPWGVCAGCERGTTIVGPGLRRDDERTERLHFTPAEAIPCVMYFCKNAKTIVIGSSVITVIASK